ncbi:unnamed protein product [Paramecium octaurelia]|uniref:Uncharacterized protein n=1 Tax=Paramecium octaurelia TaxID=43137 RepID=A0A8S1VCU0_PAROT|nr:unnamed protein product [Paramecium octaurelia]
MCSNKYNEKKFNLEIEQKKIRTLQIKPKSIMHKLLVQMKNTNNLDLNYERHNKRLQQSPKKLNLRRRNIGKIDVEANKNDIGINWPIKQMQKLILKIQKNVQK